MLEQHSIDLIGIEITINDKILDLWLIYIPPSSNPSPETFNNIFSLMNRSSFLIGGDFNGHHPVWGSSILDFRGNLIHSAILDYGLCVLNNGDATRKSIVLRISILWSTSRYPHQYIFVLLLVRAVGPLW